MYLNSTELDESLHIKDVERLARDIQRCKQLIAHNDYKVLETSVGAKSRVEYILSLNVNS